MSGRQGESHGTRKSKGSTKAKRSGKAAPRDKGGGKQRAAALGRALRSVYDDTLRESVPDDFIELLGKLS